MIMGWRFLWVGLWLLCSMAVADEPVIGQILKLSGDVVVLRGTEHLQGKPEMNLIEKDQILTGHDGRMDARMQDGTTISLLSDSVFRVRQYHYVKSASSGNSGLLDLMQGALRVITGEITAAADHRFEIGTRTATIGIRGTDVWIDASTPEVQVAMLEGHGVWVRAAERQVELNKPMQATVVRAGAKPDNPAPLKEQQALHIHHRLGGEGINGPFERFFHHHPGESAQGEEQERHPLRRPGRRP